MKRFTNERNRVLEMHARDETFMRRVGSVVDKTLDEALVGTEGDDTLTSQTKSLLTLSKKFISEMPISRFFTTEKVIEEYDDITEERLVTKPKDLSLAVDVVLNVYDGFCRRIDEACGKVESPKKHLILSAMLFDRKVYSFEVGDHIVMPLEVVSEFFQRKFSKAEEIEFGFDKLDKGDIMRTFDAMGLLPESLHRLAKDNTQFPARLVELNKNNLSIGEIAEIGENLLKIKEEVKTPVLDRDGNATGEFELLSKNPKQSESMKQIAKILKAKIEAEEKLDKKEERSVSDEVAKAAVLIKKVDPKYKTAAETAAEKAEKLSSVPSSTCQASGATQVSGGRSVFEKLGDRAKGFVSMVSGRSAAAAGGDKTIGI